MNNGENIIIVSDKWAKASNLKSSLINADSITDVTIITPQKGYIAKERMMKILRPNTENWVIVTTDNSVMASDAINSLIGLPEGMKVRVFAVEKGKTFDKIDNQRLERVERYYSICEQSTTY